jgi:hypothetical protein
MRRSKNELHEQREYTMAKYMLIMRSSDEAFARFESIDFDEVLDTMGRFNDELIRAGVLVAAEGLEDPAESDVVEFTGETPVDTEGP